MDFEIDPEYLCSVTVTKVHYPYEGRTDLTPEELAHLIKYPGPFTSTSSEDHPEFAKLRDELEQLGYIKTERSWWNGDRVLMKFRLNGACFRKGDQFPSGAAISWDVENRLKRQGKKKSVAS